MNYEIVSLEEKTIVGFSARTSNLDSEMGEIIGGLWRQLFESGTFFTMKHKVNEHSIGLYSDYENSVDGAYDVTVGCEVSATLDLPSGMTVKVIPAGRYARFVIFGDMKEAVGSAWQEIWQMPLERTFTGDFEEYVTAEDNGSAEVHIYIAVK